MKNLLDKIIETKRLQVSYEKTDIEFSEWERQPLFKREIFSLKSFLDDADKTGIIAEFKRKSPSKGVINDSSTIYEITKAYTEKGASGLSILTDKMFFGGWANDLKEARFNQIPILRKDFIIDEYQVVETKGIGADVILLIAACLSPGEVRKLSIFAKNIGLEVLLEIHNEEELEHICEEVDFVGVNNRNLKTFEVDINTSLQLINKMPADKPAISESGISDVDTIVTLRQAGYKGFLIGENFMKEGNPGKAFEEFVNNLK